jgi:flagellar biosynthesis/type III secretory pathway protein FliH
VPRPRPSCEAQSCPELAVLSVIAHGHEPGSEAIGAVALAACNRLDNPTSSLYADLIFANLDEIARAALEAIMQQHNYTYQSEFAKKYVAEGKEEGIKEGIREGTKTGIELGYRGLLRKQLQQRFGTLPDELVARLDEADAATLDTWGGRVLTAGSLAEVFDPA